MPMNALSGSRLREKRLALGLRQADLALAAGISASYLNLIEHNRRRIAPALLDRLAARLGTDAAAIADGAASPLAQDLRAVAADQGEMAAEVDQAEDLAARFPGWAALLTRLHLRGQGLSRAVEALNDRLSHDPHLSASLHDVLSLVASVASTAAILHETPDIEPEWRARFLANLDSDAKRLATGAEALVAYLDGAGQAGDPGSALPRQEMEDWLAARGWALEEAAEPQGLALLLAGAAGLASAGAQGLAAAFVARAAQDVQALPEPALRAALAETGPDPAALALRFGTPVMQVFRRLPLLPGFAAGLVLCDASGTPTFQKPIPGFSLPRLGACCPLWPLFTALARPMTPVTALVETPEGRRFRVLAYAESSLPGGFGGPELREAAMLILPLETKAAPGAAALRLGPTCRICPRGACPARREPSILSMGT